MIIEKQVCDICGNEMGIRMVEKPKAKDVLRSCGHHSMEEIDLYMALNGFKCTADRIISHLEGAKKNLLKMV